MLPGFPKTVSVTRERAGRYLVVRDDGKRFKIVRGHHRWWVNAAWTAKTLGVAIYDIKHGFTAPDQLGSHDSKDGRDVAG